VELTAQVVRQLPKSTHPDLLVGTESFDDAGVFRIDDRTALVQTLDFFPPLVDDPFTFGQIAAANALSDVYAMGGEPLTAMNIVGFPDKELLAEVLVEILRGGSERVTEAGAVVVGGHSVRDSEIKYGLSVTGRIDPRRIMTNAAARPGDRLVLTKPIGSGVLTSAAKAGRIDEAGLAEAVEVMIHLNRSGQKAVAEIGASAVTDITGFGLIGHAFEMADAAKVTLEIEAAAVPLLERTLELAGQGMLTRAHQATLDHLGAKLHVEGVDPTLVNVLCDAQTSGGLLICVAQDRAAGLVSALQRHGAPCAVVIGQVTAGGDHAICLV
jgi:selenide,water dikinase